MKQWERRHVSWHCGATELESRGDRGEVGTRNGQGLIRSGRRGNERGRVGGEVDYGGGRGESVIGSAVVVNFGQG